MPIQSPAWNEFLTCPVCCIQFDGNNRPPISLGCGHTLCVMCLQKLNTDHCPYDQSEMSVKFADLPVNRAILSLISDLKHGLGGCSSEVTPNSPFYKGVPPSIPANYSEHYLTSADYICKLAQFLRPFGSGGPNGSTTGNHGAAGTGNIISGISNLNLSGPGGSLSRSMQRKLVMLINCQIVEDEGRTRAIRTVRSLGERMVTELILHHQNHHHLSAHLWAAVRARGCQFLGPAMQEEVIKLVLLALEDGSALSRKVLVMFVVQRLESQFPQASKTSIGHVVQLLYRASCFKVSKREKDSSLMQLKEEFRTYESLRREHDAQIVQIASEAGLRIAPDQWSSLLYGDIAHKSHMQSIMDKLQGPQSFAQGVTELLFSVHHYGDPAALSDIWTHLEFLSNLDPGGNCYVDNSQSDEDSNKDCYQLETSSSLISESKSKNNSSCENINGINISKSWETLAKSTEAVYMVLSSMVRFLQHYSHRRLQDGSHHHVGYMKYGKGRGAFRQQGGHQKPGGIPPHIRSDDDDASRGMGALLPKFRSNNSVIVKKTQNIVGAPISVNNSSTTATTSTSSSTQAPISSHQEPHSPHILSKNDLERHLNMAESQMASKKCQTPTKLFEAPKVVGIPHQAQQQPPYLSIPPTPPSLVRFPSAPTHAHFVQQTAAVYSPGITHEFPPPPQAHYPAYNQQSPVFGGGAGIHPGGVSQQVPASAQVYPQAATPVLQEIYPTSPPTPGPIIVNPIAPHISPVGPAQPQLFNIVPSNLEFMYSMSKSPVPNGQTHQMVQPIASQPMVQAGPPMIQTWYDIGPAIASPPNILPPQPQQHQAARHLPEPIDNGDSPPFTSSYQASTLIPSSTGISISSLTKSSTMVTNKTLSELQEMKDAIKNKLENIVGKKETEKVEEHIANNSDHLLCIIPRTLEENMKLESPTFTAATYSIWTSGANFYSIARSCIEKEKPNDAVHNSFGHQEDKGYSEDLQNIISSSRAAATAFPIQVSASITVNSTTTSTLGATYPMLATPSISQGLTNDMYQYKTDASDYQHTHTRTGLSSCPQFDTVHHGIIDLPHLRMSQLDPSGARPSDPLDHVVSRSLSKEDRQRQQLNAVTDGIDPFSSVKKMPEEQQLKQQLSFVMHGIQKKRQQQKKMEEDTTDTSSTAMESAHDCHEETLQWTSESSQYSNRDNNNSSRFEQYPWEQQDEVDCGTETNVGNDEYQWKYGTQSHNDTETNDEATTSASLSYENNNTEQTWSTSTATSSWQQLNNYDT